ncbi:MAG: DUF502 domain-containing protein [Deltaproteobacteria bacterium]|nr:DUF502 domain-containing protein [Deltaproteobacteria bacterium]
MLKSLRKHLRQSFLTGLVTLLPLIGTIWILKMLVVWSQDFFLGLIPAAYHPHRLIGYDIPGLGLVATLLIVLIIGISLRTYLAKRVVVMGERLLGRIPVARGVYPGLKRLIQLVSGEATARASQVVLVPYPHPGSLAYAFVTGESTITKTDGTTTRYLRVFMPTAPNPTSGFLLMIPEADVIATTLTIDQASKLIVSGGLM